MTETLLTPDEVAERFGITRRTLLEHARRYQWPVIRIGRKVRFTETLVERIIAQHTTRPGVPDDGRTSASRRRSA